MYTRMYVCKYLCMCGFASGGWICSPLAWVVGRRVSPFVRLVGGLPPLVVSGSWLRVWRAVCSPLVSLVEAEPPPLLRQVGGLLPPLVYDAWLRVWWAVCSSLMSVWRNVRVRLVGGLFPLVSGAWHLNWRAACSPPWCRICSVASALLSGDFGETLGTLSACRAPVEFLFRKPALRCVAGVAPTDHLRLAPAGCRSLAGAPCRLARWWRRGGGELPQHPPCSVVRYASWWGCRRRKCQHAVGLPHLGWGCLRRGGGLPPCQAVWARQVGRKRHSANSG